MSKHPCSSWRDREWVQLSSACPWTTALGVLGTWRWGETPCPAAAGPASPPARTVAGQPLVEVDLPGQHYQLLELKVGNPGLGVLWLQVHFLLFRSSFLAVWLSFRFPAKKERISWSPHVPMWAQTTGEGPCTH